MELKKIEQWLQELLVDRYNITSIEIYALSYLDLFYLYLEIYIFFGVMLSSEEIGNTDLTLPQLAMLIYNKTKGNVI